MAWELWFTVCRASWTFARGTLLVLCISMATAPLLWQCDTVAALPDVIRIGVVYDQSWSSEEAKQLSQALDRANINASDVGEDLSQHGESGGTQAPPSTPHLSLAGVRLEPEDIFRSSKKVCGLLEQGVLAVLGSQEAETALLVRHACARNQVPHVYLHRQEGQESALPIDTLSLTVTPPAEELGRALCDLVKAEGWKQFTVIYEKPDALVRLRGLLQLHRPGRQPSIVSLRPLEEKADPRRVLREVAKAGENNIVFDLTTHRLADVLRHAQKVGIINEYHNFITTTLLREPSPPLDQLPTFPCHFSFASPELRVGLPALPFRCSFVSPQVWIRLAALLCRSRSASPKLWTALVVVVVRRGEKAPNFCNPVGSTAQCLRLRCRAAALRTP